jgi:hypothetical protein
MTWYLTIRGAPDYSRFTATLPLVEFLTSMLELRQTGPQSFEARNDHPWVSVGLAVCDPAGSYAIQGATPPLVNLVSVACSETNDTSWHRALADRIASFLGWSVCEDDA